MEVGEWLLVAAVVVLITFALWLIGRRNPLQPSLDQARQDLAVAMDRIASLVADKGDVAQQLTVLRAAEQTLGLEKSRLATSLEHAQAQLSDVSTALTVGREQRQALDEHHKRASIDLQVALTERTALREAHDTVRKELAEARTALAELEQQRVILTGDKKALATERDGLRERLQKQESWVTEQTKLFEDRVLAAAMKLMDERGRAFTDLNRKEVDAVVAPFKAQLDQFRQRVDLIYDTENKERGELKQQIMQLTSLNQSVSKEAQRLTNALTVTSKSTGDWGETILAKILEDSGLREGREYQLQHSVTGLEGERLQPDAVIFLPGGRQLVVDSKVSNKAWVEYCGAQDEGQRQARLNDHLQSLRTHVKGLAGKDYARSPDLSTVDFVLLFVPVEGALLTALSADNSLYTEAFNKKIILVTPSTLMAVVKLAEGLWTLQTRKESADEIAEAGRKLYEKLTNFADTFVAVGDAIGQSQKAFEQAQKQLATGRGNAISLAQKMVALGVSPAQGKVMPVELMGADGADSDERHDES